MNFNTLPIKQLKGGSAISTEGKRGQTLVQLLIFGALTMIVVSGLVQWAGLQIKAARQSVNRELAFSIAEAGLEYYRWHLAHAPQDFQDGTGLPGPYTHEYKNKDDQNIGRFILTITPPPTGSTLVEIVSEGKINNDSTISRKMKVKMGIPSWAKYSVSANDFLRFGAGTTVFGEIMSNQGIRFDGIANNIVSSAQESYNDPDHTGANEFGVHTHVAPVDPLPPSPVPSRADVFLAGRRFPVPALDFSGLTADLAGLKTQAQTSGLYFAGSGAQGYNLVLKTNDTLDLYRVNSVVVTPPGCSSTQNGWGTWSVNAQTLLGNFPFPTNGIIFLEDHVWVEGQINTARLTIGSGRFPETPSNSTNITVNNNLRYTNFDGSDSIGLIAQNNFNVGLISANDLFIDGALVAKSGRAGRHYYRSQCGTGYIRNSLTLKGVIISNLRYGFAYTDGTGYLTRNLNYDSNLLYAPPPNFPLTSDQYTTLSWEEVN